MSAEQNDQSPPPGIITVATSAGGLSALRELLGGLPSDFALPILIVQHLAPDHPSRLARILSSATALTVTEARDGERAQAGHAYMAPPDWHLTVDEEGCMRLTDEPRVHFSRPSADVLFASAVDTYGPGTIGVVLSGAGSDGADGAMRIREAGGTVLCSDKETSEHFMMPKAAIDRDAVDEVLPLQDIAARLLDIVTSRSNK